MQVCRPTECVQIRSQYVCIATGSRPNRPSHYSSHVPLDFTQRYVVTATELGNMAEVPRAVVVLGGGGNASKKCLPPSIFSVVFDLLSCSYRS